MALALSLASNKPFSATDSSSSLSSYRKQQSNIFFPLRKKYRRQSRALCIVTGSDSGESNSPVIRLSQTLNASLVSLMMMKKIIWESKLHYQCSSFIKGKYHQ